MNKKQNNTSKKIIKTLGTNLVLFYILSWTWGFIESFIGLVIILPLLITKQTYVYKGRLCGKFPKCFGLGWGFEMGCFFFTSNDVSINPYSSTYLKTHEYGHTVQNVIFGPLMLFIVSIPSAIRYWYRLCRIKKDKYVNDYESVWFEKQATRFGQYCIYYND